MGVCTVFMTNDPFHISSWQNIGSFTLTQWPDAVGFFLQKPSLISHTNAFSKSSVWHLVFGQHIRNYSWSCWHLWGFSACGSFKCYNKHYYTYNDLIMGISMFNLLKMLSSSCVFRRGLLPQCIFRIHHLPKFSRSAPDRQYHRPWPSLPAWWGFREHPLSKMFELRWLQNEVAVPQRFYTTFALPLNMRYVQWKLLGQSGWGCHLQKLHCHFVITVIHKFIPLNLSAPQTFGTTTQSMPEAQLPLHKIAIHHFFIGIKKSIWPCLLPNSGKDRMQLFVWLM